MPATLFGCRPGGDGDVVVMGLPADAGSTMHPGCALAPRVLRDWTAMLGLAQGFIWDLSTRTKVLDGVYLTDLGDIPYRLTAPREAFLGKIADISERANSDRKRVLSLGGDHLVALPIIQGLARRQAFQVVQLDAHTDYLPVLGELPTHANFMHFVDLEPNVQRVVTVGVRGFGPELFGLPHKTTLATLAGLSAALIPSLPVYLTIDTDAFDPVVAPGVGHPLSGGLQWSAIDVVLASIRAQGCALLGADWVEYNPRHDTPSQITAAGIVPSLVKIVAALGAS